MFEYRGIDVNDLDEIVEEINLIDIREYHEFKIGTIEGAKNIPSEELLKNPEKYLDKYEKYYIMCRAGSKSLKACKELSAKGYDVYDVEGGFSSYEGDKRI
ncbi:Rhodanese-related sulfurtransferase [Clostridium sp. DSM 8431]|uniref:rhodanese-like domain-containing protein n=1 Tax=Clostridium sp. DSM 8431 TaxID=1761781 RepID=UPI0008E82D60|nr:rhodanese-like domain-containing protein [Clostridium sp. DSM 8431]SFU70825.1 Rhodanese-related sulfurtransferase [Clostridium sp. DSM 8431]